MMRVELPWPDASLAPNRKNGRHWSGVHAAKVRRLADARCLTLAAMQAQGYVPPPGKLALTITFHAPDKRRRDLDNLLAAMKPDLDGVSCALGVDDQFFEPLTLCRGAVRKPGCVVLEMGHE